MDRWRPVRIQVRKHPDWYLLRNRESPWFVLWDESGNLFYKVQRFDTWQDAMDYANMLITPASPSTFRGQDS